MPGILQGMLGQGKAGFCALVETRYALFERVRGCLLPSGFVNGVLAQTLVWVFLTSMLTSSDVKLLCCCVPAG